MKWILKKYWRIFGKPTGKTLIECCEINDIDHSNCDCFSMDYLSRVGDIGTKSGDASSGIFSNSSPFFSRQFWHGCLQSQLLLFKQFRRDFFSYLLFFLITFRTSRFCDRSQSFRCDFCLWLERTAPRTQPHLI